MNIALTGFLTGLSLIVAIGAQNAYVLRLGLMRAHVGVAVVICSISDAVLIIAGTAGMGALVQANQSLLKVISYVGAAYLFFYALKSLNRARKPDVLLPSEQQLPTTRKVILAVLAFTWLNPHVYLDTVLLLGSIGSQFGSDRWQFALGASIASLLWFSALGFGSKALARFMAKQITWRILDLLIAAIMIWIAISLLKIK